MLLDPSIYTKIYTRNGERGTSFIKETHYLNSDKEKLSPWKNEQYLPSEKKYNLLLYLGSRDGAVVKTVASRWSGPYSIPVLCHMWSLLFVSSLLRGFFFWFYGFHPSSTTNISKFWFDQDRWPSWKSIKADVASSQILYCTVSYGIKHLFPVPLHLVIWQSHCTLRVREPFAYYMEVLPKLENEPQQCLIMICNPIRQVITTERLSAKRKNSFNNQY